LAESFVWVSQQLGSVQESNKALQSFWVTNEILSLIGDGNKTLPMDDILSHVGWRPKKEDEFIRLQSELESLRLENEQLRIEIETRSLSSESEDSSEDSFDDTVRDLEDLDADQELLVAQTWIDTYRRILPEDRSMVTIMQEYLKMYFNEHKTSCESAASLEDSTGHCDVLIDHWAECTGVHFDDTEFKHPRGLDPATVREHLGFALAYVRWYKSQGRNVPVGLRGVTIPGWMSPEPASALGSFCQIMGISYRFEADEDLVVHRHTEYVDDYEDVSTAADSSGEEDDEDIDSDFEHLFEDCSSQY